MSIRTNCISQAFVGLTKSKMIIHDQTRAADQIGDRIRWQTHNRSLANRDLRLTMSDSPDPSRGVPMFSVDAVELLLSDGLMFSIRHTMAAAIGATHPGPTSTARRPQIRRAAQCPAATREFLS
jgi:hypothetical protein